MKSVNQLKLSGKVVAVRECANSRSLHFVLIHHFGGGKPPLLLHCATPQDVIIKEKDDVTVTGYLKGRKTSGKIEAYITNVSLNNE